MKDESNNADADGSKSLGEQFAESFGAFWKAAYPEGPRSKGNEALLRRLSGLKPKGDGTDRT